MREFRVGLVCGVFACRTPQCLSSLPQVSGAREHGDPDTFAPEVSQALQKLYPDDAATGFEIGDLRGAFRVAEQMGSFRKFL
jgi:hypothetical protein